MMRKNYKFKNNGFKILWKQISVMSLISIIVFTIVFLIMIISSKYTFIQSAKVLLMIPAVIMIMVLFFSIFFISFYFTFEVSNNEIKIHKGMKKYCIKISEIKKIDINKYDRQSWMKIKTSNQLIKLNLVGPGGHKLYTEFFSVIDEIQNMISAK